LYPDNGYLSIIAPVRHPHGTAAAYHPDVTVELRQLRCFVAVVESGSFTRAAEQLYVAQQAVSQQIKALEASVGVALLTRTSRKVELTPAGAVFLTDCRRVLSAADRAVRRAQAAARGEVGTLRLAYTLTTAYDTVPALLTRLAEHHPQVKVEAREVFAEDIPQLLSTGRADLALAPATSYDPDHLTQRLIRLEPLRLAVGERHPLADRTAAALDRLHDELFEVWPRQMAPGYYDAVVGACRAAGFEPRIDEHAAGSTVWGAIAQGHGIGLVVSSLHQQVPRGVRLIDLTPPQPPPLGVAAVWVKDGAVPAVDRFLEAAAQLGAEHAWT
jgi:DNA-binding transcriptional LysR family regulator